MSDDVLDIGSLTDCYVTQLNGKRALTVNSGGTPLDVKIRQAVTAFNEVVTAEFRTQTGWSFSYNINEQIVSIEEFNGGTVSQEGSFAKLETGTEVDGSAFLRSNRSVIYTPGRGARIVFTAVFSTPKPNNQQIQGVINNSDGWAFGYQGEVFGIIKRRSSIDLFIPQSEWNIDTKPDLIPQYGNVYAIDFQWLGFGAQFFSIENDAGELGLVHVILYSNKYENVSVENATLPLSAIVKNQGNNTNIILKTPSAVGGIYSEPFDPSFEALIAYDFRNAAITVGETYLFALRNPLTWLGKENRLYIRPVFYVAAAEGNKPVTFRVYANPTLTGAVWNDVTPDQSPLQYDESATFILNGEREVFTVPVGKSDARVVNVSDLNSEIVPGQSFAFTVDADSLSDVRVGLTLKSRT